MKFPFNLITQSNSIKVNYFKISVLKKFWNYNLSNQWRSNVMLCMMETKKSFPNLLTTPNEVSLITNWKMRLKELKKVDVFNFSIHQMEYGTQRFRKKVSFLLIQSKSSSFGSFIEIECIHITGFLNNITRPIIRWSKDTSLKV